MQSLFLAAVLAAGADPAAPAEPGVFCPPVVAQNRLPRGPVEKMKAKVAALAMIGRVPSGGTSYLYQPAFAEDFVIRGPARPYTPQPGDMAFSADESAFWTAMHHLAGTSHPTHSMVVFALPDGRPAILEGGPHDTLRCRVLEPVPHLASYEAEGRVWVRRRKCPATPEQSARLTEFCTTLDGRDFSIRRLAVQLTPFRARGPLRTAFVGKPHGMDRKAYYCSELVCEALAYAGLMDPATTRPSATYPRDIFFGDSKNPYLHRHLPPINCDWDAPARWTTCPITPVVDARP